MPFERVCVFCGSAGAALPRFGDLAYDTGRRLAAMGIGVVYGGGSVGLMGQVAAGALSLGGEVIGVIPRKLHELEVGHPNLTRLEVVETMHHRKARMAELSDAFLALPGGWGTWEELFEAMTWTQLGYHAKPCGVLDAHGYYAPLRAMLRHAREEGFVREELGEVLTYGTDLDEVLLRMEEAVLPALETWLDAP
jgi:uncharacterized protein (TIGR00730 family)